MNAAAAGTLACLTTSLLVGCVDARGAYDEYGSRVVDADDTMIDGEIVSALPDVDGEWLLAVRPNLPEDRIIQFRTTFDLTPVTENTGTISFTAQPLSVTDGTPVGDPFVANERGVGSDARFDAPMSGELHGDANPVIPGSAAFVNAVLLGELRTAEFLCGTMTGTAGSLPLDGTTWGAVRITGDELPPYVINCDGN